MTYELKHRRVVYILRGPSGCGKSTWVEGLKLQSIDPDMIHVVSADSYFMVPIGDEDGLKTYEYQFDPRKLAIAHSECFNQFLKHLRTEGDCIIIVDNTNIHRWEFQNYVEAAGLAGFDVVDVPFVTESTTLEEVREWARRNEHGTPPEVVAKMAIEFEL